MASETAWSVSALARPAPLRAQGRSLASLLVCGWAFLLPVQLNAAGLRLAPSDAFIGIYAVLALPTLRVVPRSWSGWHLGLVAMIWVALGHTVLTYGDVPRSTLVEKALGVLVLVVTYACVVDYARTTERLLSVLRAFVLGSVTSAGLALLTFAGDKLALWHLPFVNEPYRTTRLSGLLIDPNAYGGLLATALLLHVVTAAAGQPLLLRPRTRWLADLLLPLTLVLTFSRSAWIGATLGLATVLLVQASLFGRAVRRLAPASALALPAVLIHLPDAGALARRHDQVEGRLTIANWALHDVSGDPVVGIGLGVFERRHGVIVHDTALWFLTEMGLVGLVLFVAFVAAQVLRARRVILRGNRVEAALAAGLLAGLLVGLGVSVGIEAFYQRYWWLVFAGIGAAYAARPRERGP